MSFKKILLNCEHVLIVCKFRKQSVRTWNSQKRRVGLLGGASGPDRIKKPISSGVSRRLSSSPAGTSLLSFFAAAAFFSFSACCRLTSLRPIAGRVLDGGGPICKRDERKKVRKK